MTQLLFSTNQFTLTCISTGGPATTVTWTRDSITVTEGTKSVVSNNITALYTHTLMVNEREPGHYRCSVSNLVSNVTYAELNVTGMNGLYFVQPFMAATCLSYSTSPSWCYCVPEWTGECASLLDTRTNICDWILHLLQATRRYTGRGRPYYKS